MGKDGAPDPSPLGLVPISRASKIANGFLFWYITASMVWIVSSDALLQILGQVAHLPPWAQSVKGLAYILIFGFALRQAARVYVEGVERAHKAHIEAKLELVHRLALAAEYRDDETGGHNGRIGRFATVVGRELGLDAKVCETLSYAASLHDLGKIGIPDALLHKPGIFTPDERTAMQRHTLLGAEILSDGQHPLVVMSHAIALTHHERWDGAGYPRGLSGTEIPIEGRIVAVCDVFDALVSQRPYKAAWTVEDAVAEIASLRGSAFDPDVVGAFLRCLPEIEAVRQKVGACPLDAPKLHVAA
jgi:putative two-component system response regulator